MQNVGRLYAQARIITKATIDADHADRDEDVEAIRNEVREWAFKSLVGLRVEVAEFEVE
jgi:hypothetical protein